MSQISSVASSSKALTAMIDTLEGSPMSGPHPCRLDSKVLLAGGVELMIDHGGETYRLRLTRRNRLILTK